MARSAALMAPARRALRGLAGSLLAVLLLPGVSAQEGAALARLARAGADGAEQATLSAAVRRLGEPGAALARRMGPDTADALVRAFGSRAAEVFARHGDAGVQALRRIGPRLAGGLPADSDLLIRAVLRHGDEAVDVLRAGGPDALRVVAELGEPGLRFARLTGAEAGPLYGRGGAPLVYQALRRPETVDLLREAGRAGATDAFLHGVRTHGDRFVVWVGSRWKQVGFITALATFVAIAPDAVEQAGVVARDGVGELGGAGMFGVLVAGFAALALWDLARRRWGGPARSAEARS